MKRNGSSGSNVLRHYLILQGFKVETLALLTRYNLRKLAEEYKFDFARIGGKYANTNQG